MPGPGSSSGRSAPHHEQLDTAELGLHHRSSPALFPCPGDPLFAMTGGDVCRRGGPMTARTWLASRVALALVLMGTFYLLALGLSFGLLWLAYVDLFEMRRVHLKIVVFCVVGAGAILWSIVP